MVMKTKINAHVFEEKEDKKANGKTKIRKPVDI